MVQRTFSSRLMALPDRACPSLRLAAGGVDVATAARADQEHLLRALAAFSPSSVSVAIQFLYTPTGSNPQARLAISLVGYAHTDESAASLSILLRNGPVRRLHRLTEGKGTTIPWDEFGATCDVVRVQNIFAATVPSELNAKALPAYHAIRPFEPRQDNDYLLSDRILSQLEEPAFLEVRVEPADVAREVAAHVRYLARLQQINRSWDHDDDDLMGADWAVGEGRRTAIQPVKPLRTRDPLVDDVLRLAQRFHEGLAVPYLAFHIRTYARTKAMARLLASVVAESAFEDGSYCLFDSVRGEDHYEALLREPHRPRVTGVPALQHLLAGRNIALYDGLARLANLASVDELVGVFRFPMASHGSPHCIRKNTDPPTWDKDEMFLVGEDAQFLSDT
ncbi:MAG: hypothetical protein NTX87_06595 [Planctomycetota bacterium]|nr:hypothetical protein [Planctomycetota bacterium]